MTDKEILEGNKLIADAGGWKLSTNFPPHVYQNGSDQIDTISFHKSKMLGRLIQIVDLLEQKYDLYIIIKREQCVIQEMRLTSNRTIVSVEGKTKQNAVWLAIIEFLNTQSELPEPKS